MLGNVYEQSGNRDISEQCKYSLGTVGHQDKYIMACVIHSWRIIILHANNDIWSMTYGGKIYGNFNNILSFLCELKTNMKL